MIIEITDDPEQKVIQFTTAGKVRGVISLTQLDDGMVEVKVMDLDPQVKVTISGDPAVIRVEDQARTAHEEYVGRLEHELERHRAAQAITLAAIDERLSCQERHS